MGKKERKFVVTVWLTPANSTWYWQLNSPNGRLIAVCPSNGYTSKRNAENAVKGFAKAMTRGFFTTRVIAAEQREAA